MLHLKRVDIEWQVRWFSEMTEAIKDNAAVQQHIRDYYAASRQKIVDYHKKVAERRRVSGIDE